MFKLLLLVAVANLVAFAQPQTGPNGSASFLMHRAALRGETKSVEMMLKLGADVDAMDEQGKTPLHDACIKGHADTARLLLDRGANVNARDKNGTTPLHDAALGGAPAVVKLLLDRKADAGARDKESQTALDYARKMDRTEAARILQGALPSR